MMFKKILLPLVLMIAAGAAIADDYTYVAGGWQYGRINSADDMNEALIQKYITPSGSITIKGGGTRQQMNSGFYLQGGYGFDNNLFLDMRLNGMYNKDFTIMNNLLGTGYHYALSDNADLYVLGGISQHGIANNLPIFDSNKVFTSATGEAGLNVKLTPDIRMNTALRLADYDGQTYYEMRLGAGYALTEHVSVEAGYQYHHWKVDDQTGTVGLRYTF